MKSLPDKYNFVQTQLELQQAWQQENIYKFSWEFNGENSKSIELEDSANNLNFKQAGEEKRDEIFSIDTPPPTISGSLHMGHIFSYCHTDFITRYQRMKGKKVFYPMGFDNNGLPTERLVEKEYKIAAHNSDNKEFLRHCQDISKKNIKEFKELFNNIGLSVDWDLQYDTCNERCQYVSQKSFIELYNKGLIYRKESPVFWDPIDQTAIAQGEVEEKEFSSFMNYIDFSLKTNEESQLLPLTLTIATTRPELLAACVAIFFHPEDLKYKYLRRGQLKAIVPLFNYEIPIIADESVLIDKGTGLVMCCTFGDEMDINWWKKHNLPLRPIINRQGKILPPMDMELKGQGAEIFESLKGKKIPAAREIILEKLTEAGLLKGQEKINHNVKCAERSGAKLEIIMTPQWYINLLDYKQELLECASQINWFPAKMFVRIKQWIEGLKWDWCISRQRYLGVPIPVWYSKKDTTNSNNNCHNNCNNSHNNSNNNIILPKLEELPINPRKQAPKGFNREDLIAETDVLDTWATSSLTPEINNILNNSLNKSLLPMDLRPQAHEIIRTWAFYTIARSFLKDGEIPWKNIMISGWCLSEEREKMSKSKGNVISPLELMKTYGADVIRYWAASASLGADTAYSTNTFAIGKKLVNKLWNASRFVSQFIISEASADKISYPIDLWLIYELSNLIQKIETQFVNYNYSGAKELIEKFFWHEYCDNYLELVKARAYQQAGPGHESVLCALSLSLKIILKLFAPFLPFVTEEIYVSLYKEGSIHKRGSWPDNKNLLANNNQKNNQEKARNIPGREALEILAQVRELKSMKNLSIKHLLEEIKIIVPSEDLLNSLQEMSFDLKNACNIEKIIWQLDTELTKERIKIIVTEL